MAKRPPIDLAAAMEAELRSHDPMSTRTHVMLGTKDHAPTIPMAHEVATSGDHEPTLPLAHETDGTGSHDVMSTSSHDARARQDAAPIRHNKPELVSQSAESDDSGAGASYIPPSREGMKRIQGYFSPRVKRQLRLLAVNLDTSEEDLVARALNMLFSAEGLPAIAFDGKEQRRAS